MNQKNFFLVDKENYKKIQQVFDLNNHRLVLKSIINKNTPGLIYVDSADNQQTALIWDYGHYFFILGEKINDGLVKPIQDILFNKIFIKAKDSGIILDYEIECFSKDIENSINKLFLDFPVMKNTRRYYSIDLSFDNNIESNNDILNKKGFNIFKIDRNFLSNSDFKNLEEINKWIDENWISVEDFLVKGFGMCLEKDGTIVSWCLTDYVVEDECEIGIETDEEYREQGFGTFLVQQVLNYCKDNNIKKVGWHCKESNVASYRLAERVGFLRKLDYNYYHGWYNSFDNNLVNGYYYLDQIKDFKKGAEFYKKAFNMIDSGHDDALSSAIFAQEGVKMWCYYSAACCLALANDSDNSFTNIYKAIDEGWSDLEMLANDERLISLHDDNRWDSIFNYDK